jgi:hypothetical protein
MIAEEGSMAGKKVRAVTRRRAVDDALDELYAAPLPDFITRRKQLADRLRKDGRADDARIVAAVGKPKATVWAIDHVARAEPKLVTRAVDAFDRLRAAQIRHPEQMTDASRSFRDAVEAVVHRAIAAMKDAGLSTTLDTHRRIANTIRGAATSARGALVDGTLTDEVAPGGFELFEGTTPRGRRLRAVRGKPVPPPRERKAEASAELARRRAAQLETEAGAHESHARQAAAAVFKAREQLRELEKAAREAMRTASKSRRLADRAGRSQS